MPTPSVSSIQIFRFDDGRGQALKPHTYDVCGQPLRCRQSRSDHHRGSMARANRLVLYRSMLT
jgi:hypothetical protein